MRVERERGSGEGRPRLGPQRCRVVGLAWLLPSSFSLGRGFLRLRILPAAPTGRKDPPHQRRRRPPSVHADIITSRMMLGVHPPVGGFDCAAAADGADGGGADAFWGPCKRLRSSSSGPIVCSLNTDCVDIPEICPKAVEASGGGGPPLEEAEGGIQRPTCLADVVACPAKPPMDADADLQERPRKSKLPKRLANVGVRRSPRLVKLVAKAEFSTSPPQLSASLGALEPDESEASKNFSVVTCQGEDRSELEVVELPKGSNKAAETLESPAGGICRSGQSQVCSPETGSTKNSGNVAPRRSPRLMKCTNRSNEFDQSADLPELPTTSPATPTSDAFVPLNNLGGDPCREQSVGCEFAESSGCSIKGKTPRLSTEPKFSTAKSLDFGSGARWTEGPDGASQSQTSHSACPSRQQNERELMVVLALPCSSSNVITRNSRALKYSSSSSIFGSCKENSPRSKAVEPLKPLDKMGSCESSGKQKPDYPETLKHSGECKLSKKSINAPPRWSPHLKKDAVHGNVYNSPRPSAPTNLTGSLKTQNIFSSVTCKEASPQYETMEVMSCLDKLEESPQSWKARKLGTMTGETGSLADSDNGCQGQSLQLAEDGDCGDGCELSRKLYKHMSVTQTKVVHSPSNYPAQRIISGQGPQDIGEACKEESLSTTSSSMKDLGKKKGAECKEIVTRKMVKETLRLFQAICRKLLREEESKAREACHNNRVDVMALNLIKEKGKCLNVGEHYFGSVPGVEIGDEFHYRAELSIIGLHRNILAGISYAKHDGIYVASSVVFYEGYFDFMERSDVLLYSGSVGNPNSYYRNRGEKKQGDQKLERGNLALKNSMDVQIPIRVVLGLKEPKASDCRTSKAKGSVTYVYDGLYLAEKYWSVIGNDGFSIFKFQLRRLPGQRQLAIKEIQNSKGFKVHRGLRIEDLSQGKEKVPIVVVNIIDDEHPSPFRYINRVIYPSLHRLTPSSGCDCTDGCSDSVNCACAVKNGGEIPFNYDGAIVEAKPLVYECGPSCKCPPSCHNRVSQHGIKYPLEVFKTRSMGWGVRSLTSIPSGNFICEYTGEMIEENEANRRTNDDYLFDIGQNYYDKTLWEGLSTCIPGLLQDASCDVIEDECFTIDAVNYGNIGRFINHSCSPNLYAQNVLFDHDDKRMPHIMFFAAENISPLEELTYHYNYAIDQVQDMDGNVKKKHCYCGSVECTGRLY